MALFPNCGIIGPSKHLDSWGESRCFSRFPFGARGNERGLADYVSDSEPMRIALGAMNRGAPNICEYRNDFGGRETVADRLGDCFQNAVKVDSELPRR